ncbi:hypothetical protein TIFTF001_007019 [Ficus carica]|uniref:Glycosyltransferase n=1 Tax=Ficus carica TaxID=3494 RepID=A0AA88A1Y0_FICCA|nr:hypothetical protein TIFTF001_007019 [Ficus carica]
MAKLFASRGLKSTIVTTSPNAQLHSKTVQNGQNMGMDIGVLVIKFPDMEQPASREPASNSAATTEETQRKFIETTAVLEEQLGRLLKEHRPDCLVADAFFTWATDVAAKLEIPRVIFHGTGFFPLCTIMSVLVHEPHEKVESDSEPFTIPNLPDEVKLTRKQLPPYVKKNADSPFTKSYREAKEAELKCFGVVVNSFYELERNYADHYRRVLGRKVWHIGPVSLCNYKINGKGEAGIDQAAIEEHECLKWLDLKKPNSVVYVCFGSMASIGDAQLMEIATGLEDSGKQFIWVVKKEKKQEGVKEEWLPQGFEERVDGKGLIIRGWAPQVMILEHKAVGGFLTHCGWNSMLEAVCAGVPMVTWPMFSEQFYNEKFVTQVLGVGVGVGAKEWAIVVEESVKREAIEKAVKRIMEGEEAEEMRSRANVLREMARTAFEEGGSSYSDFDAFVEELRRHRNA